MKGKVNERKWASICTNEGYPARRGQQFRGGEDSPDVICESLPIFHFEVKAGKRPHLWNAVDQALRDRKTGQLAIAALHRDFCPWMVGMLGDDFFRMVRGDHL
jgi:hypothetical protein